MGKFGRMRRLALWGVLLATLAACAATYSFHGYAPSDRELQDITVGVDTRESVAEAIGRPGATGVIKDRAWYYLSSKWRHFAWKAPEVIDRQLVAISFNDRGVVTNIERFTLEDGRVVALSRRITKSNVKGVSLIEQLLRNIGNFNPSDVFQG